MDPLIIEATVAAPIEAVWAAWTTEEGVKSFFAPAARLEPRPGGAYEMLFMLDNPPGTQGGEGCTVLSVEAPTRLTFTWNFPPHLPLRDERTEVEVWVTAAEGGTHVRLAQRGWQAGPDWAAGRAYFQVAWQIVIGRLVRRFAVGPIDWADPYTPAVER